jgi:Asp-tRNA(Asn)/Glu-tRNA(Gln) amidotransferase B subunit
VNFLLEKKEAQITDDAVLLEIISQVLSEHPKAVISYGLGKVEVISFFIGQVMQKTTGKADQQKTRKLLEAALKNSS